MVPKLKTGDGVYVEEKTSKHLHEENAGDNTTSQLLPHYLVSNCDLVRVRYLLVYAKQPTSMRFTTPSTNRNGKILFTSIVSKFENDFWLYVSTYLCT